jgi:RNA polymerase sigma-70 factor (ECF subfamily)
MMVMQVDAHADEELIPGLLARDEKAVEALVDRYWARAYRVAYQLVGQAAAEDVAQETMLEVLRSVDRFEPGRPFRPWFFKILKHVALTHQRTEARRKRRERKQHPPPQVASHERVDAVESVRTYLARLTPALRETLALHYLEGLTHREVAEALGCAEGTVASRIHRGLESLRAKLQPAVNLAPLGARRRCSFAADRARAPG